MATWHPDAKRVPYQSAGGFVSAGHKIVWHTTEGGGLPAYSGTAPHFTFNPATNELWQHVPINEASSSLVHPAGVETNHAHAIQVELVGHAAQTPGWNRDAYARIARLARWIEANADVPRQVVPGASFMHPQRLSPRQWLEGAGHCGHMHVPGNDHTDPGAGFRIGLVLDHVDPRKKIHFTAHEAHTLRLVMATRAAGISGDSALAKKRRSNLRRYKATLLVYRAKLRIAAAVPGGGGWDAHDRRGRYNGILTVYKGGTVAL